ncbi:hypothetical protein KSZ_60970 [Dictyobacter formicarum]|uniref:Uncharacterized protein n=1 Tax=Dictyobacter formicarum TaxID=2778368 RepID=A0ABQ3VRY4_9CHLR|nr:hypothetical protein KSZ_60970 [Dictyobacter formicarum]
MIGTEYSAMFQLPLSTYELKMKHILAMPINIGSARVWEIVVSRQAREKGIYSGDESDYCEGTSGA